MGLVRLCPTSEREGDKVIEVSKRLGLAAVAEKGGCSRCHLCPEQPLPGVCVCRGHPEVEPLHRRCLPLAAAGPAEGPRPRQARWK